MPYSLLVTISALFMLPGIAGLLLPVVPGIPYMFIVALIFGIVDTFQHLSSRELLILGGLALASLLVDYFSGLLGAKLGGASKKAILFGFIGLLIGMILLPPLGAIIGLFVGVIVGELQRHVDEHKALKAATGSLIGTLTGIAINLILALVFIVLFVLFALK